jgi:hypothetical protein
MGQLRYYNVYLPLAATILPPADFSMPTDFPS